MQLLKKIEQDIASVKAELAQLEWIRSYIRQASPKKKKKKKGLHPNAAKGLKAYYDKKRKERNQED